MTEPTPEDDEDYPGEEYLGFDEGVKKQDKPKVVPNRGVESPIEKIAREAGIINLKKREKVEVEWFLQKIIGAT